MAIPTNPVLDWAIIELDETGQPTKVDPPVEAKNTGLVKGQPWPRLWHNYALNNFSEYLKHLAVDPLLTVKTVEVSTGPTYPAVAPQTTGDAATEWGGVWTRDNSTLSGFYLFTKTAM